MVKVLPLIVTVAILALLSDVMTLILLKFDPAVMLPSKVTVIVRFVDMPVVFTVLTAGPGETVNVEL
mgnify:CR=1 FL=1